MHATPAPVAAYVSQCLSYPLRQRHQCSQRERLWWKTSRQCQPWLWRPFQQFTQRHRQWQDASHRCTPYPWRQQIRCATALPPAEIAAPAPVVVHVAPAAAVFVAHAPVAEYISRGLPCSWRQRQWRVHFARAVLVCLLRGASCSRTRSISANGRAQLLCVVRFLPETLRRHPLLLAVASSRDVASSLSQTAAAAAKRCRSGLLCRTLRTRQMSPESEEEGRPSESHPTLVR